MTEYLHTSCEMGEGGGAEKDMNDEQLQEVLRKHLKMWRDLSVWVNDLKLRYEKQKSADVENII